MFEGIWFYLSIIFGVTIVALIVLILIERERRLPSLREAEHKKEEANLKKMLLPRAGRSVSDETIKEVKNRLRVLDVEREILSYAIRRLYEAHAEGKITLEERDSLAQKYRVDLERVKQEIARGESMIALSDLERMQEEFIKMFSEKIEEINRRIEELRAIAGLKLPEQIAPPSEETGVSGRPEEAQSQQEQTEKQATQKRRREMAKQKVVEQNEHEAEDIEKTSEADKSVEQIMAEIEKVLSRLSQIEAEE